MIDFRTQKKNEQIWEKNNNYYLSIFCVLLRVPLSERIGSYYKNTL